MNKQIVKLKKINSSAFLCYHGHLVFQLFLLLLIYFGHIQSKSEITSLEVSIFQKSAKTEVKTFRLTKIEEQLLSNIILDAQASDVYHGFYNSLDIFSQKERR